MLRNISIQVTKLDMLVHRGEYHKTTTEDCMPQAIMTPLSAFVVVRMTFLNGNNKELIICHIFRTAAKVQFFRHCIFAPISQISSKDLSHIGWHLILKPVILFEGWQIIGKPKHLAFTQTFTEKDIQTRKFKVSYNLI